MSKKEMDTDLPVRNLIVNHPRRAVGEGLLATFQPAMRPPDLNFEWRIEGQRILFQFSPWGNIGFLTLKDLTPSRMEILFYPPPFPTQQETEQLEFAIRSEILDNRPTYDDLHNSREMGLNYLAQRLYHYKQSLLVRIRHWLAQALGIWGLIEERSTPYDFSFVIDGNPAQFAVMLRYFFQAYRPPDYRRDVEVIVMRSDLWPLREIPAEINPIEVNILYEAIQLSISIHTMPKAQSLLRVNLVGGAKSWYLWDVIRDEMARADWFRLPEVPKQLVEEADENRPLEPNKRADDIQDPWLRIPDEGNKRLVVQLWNQNHTSKEIGQKIGSSEKTILNRIIDLRKQFGPQIVLYRKVRKTKAKDRGK
jgi:hypothetical protein